VPLEHVEPDEDLLLEVELVVELVFVVLLDVEVPEVKVLLPEVIVWVPVVDVRLPDVVEKELELEVLLVVVVTVLLGLGVSGMRYTERRIRERIVASRRRVSSMLKYFDSRSSLIRTIC
jgi:hypothetical protein